MNTIKKFLALTIVLFGFTKTSQTEENKFKEQIKGLALKSCIIYSQGFFHELGHAAAAKILGYPIKKFYVFPPNPALRYGYVSIDTSADLFPHYFKHVNDKLCSCKKRKIIFGAAGPLLGMLYNYSLLKGILFYNEYKETGSIVLAFKNSFKKSPSNVFSKENNEKAINILKQYAYIGLLGDIQQFVPIMGFDGEVILKSSGFNSKTHTIMQAVGTPLILIGSSVGLRSYLNLTQGVKETFLDTLGVIFAAAISKLYP